MDQHLLSIILFTPLAGLAVLLFIPSKSKDLIRIWANLAALPGFWFRCRWCRNFDASADGFQFVERADWIPSLGVKYLIGIDGISLLLVMLTTLMGFMAMLCSWTAIEDRLKEYYAMFLLLQTGMIGVFLSLDFFLFYVFWELVLVPMYFIIGVWGGPRKLYAAIKFFLYTLAGSRADAARHPDALLPALQPVRQLHFRDRRTDEAERCRSGCSSGSSGRSSSASPSRCRCSRSTPGCRTRTWKPRPRAP